MGSDGELKSFGHAPIRLRGVIRRRDLSLLKIQFFRTTEDDFIARAAKHSENRAVKGSETKCR